MKKPKTLKGIQVLFWILIGLAFLEFFLTVVAVASTESKDVNNSDMESVSYSFGRFIGNSVIFLFTLSFIYTHWFKTMVVILILSTLTSIIHPIVFLFYITMLILLFTDYTNIKNYMKQARSGKNENNEALAGDQT